MKINKHYISGFAMGAALSAMFTIFALSHAHKQEMTEILANTPDEIACETKPAPSESLPEIN